MLSRIVRRESPRKISLKRFFYSDSWRCISCALFAEREVRSQTWKKKEQGGADWELENSTLSLGLASEIFIVAKSSIMGA